MQFKFKDVNTINEDGEQENEPIITRTCSGCLSNDFALQLSSIYH